MQPEAIASMIGSLLILSGLSVILIIQLNLIQQPMDTIKSDIELIYLDLILIGFGVVLLLKSISRNY